jgi:DnaJ-class molecular chaperone
MDKIFNPEKYGMKFCSECKGKGKLPKNPHGYNVCLRCGGCGVIIKAPERMENKPIVTESSELDKESTHLL